MEIEWSIEKWNARWMIVSGRVVCTRCMESQALEDCDEQFSHARACDEQFSHARACEATGEGVKHPWVALHDILDCARG